MTPQNIQAVRDTAEMIRAMLGDDFDDQTFLDTLDGETDAMDMVGYLVRSRVEAQEIEKAMKAISATYTARARRHAAKVNAINAGLGELLDAIGQTKVQHDCGTVSRTKPRVSMVVLDADAIPSQLCKAVPDNAAIKAQLEAGETVPGAALVEGEASISVRVK